MESYLRTHIFNTMRVILLAAALIGLTSSCSSNASDSRETRIDSQIVMDTSVIVEAAPAKNHVDSIMAKKQVPVLCYHRFEYGRTDDYNVTPAQFDAQMKILKDSGYQSILPDQLYDYLVYNKPIPEKPFMVTFDDNRLEHITVANEVLKKYGFKGVYFIMTITIGKKNYMNREQIAQLAAEGNTVGNHTYDHHKVTAYNDEDWQKQIVEANQTISEITGQPVTYFAYPFGIVNHTAAQELSKHYKMSFILSTPRDSLVPLQTVRRMIVAHKWTPQGMLKVMNSTFSKR